MTIDLFLFFYCSSVLLSFSIFLFDGYLIFCLIWIFSIFLATSNNSAALPDFVRLVWFLFFSSMLLGRYLYVYIFVQKRFLRLNDHYTSNLLHDSNVTTDLLSINPSIFRYYIGACLLILFLSISGFGQNPEFIGINAASKSQVPYVINGFLSTLLIYWTFSIILASRNIASSSISKFFNRVLPFRVISGLVGALKFSAYLASYATKIFSPLLGYLMLRYYINFSWISIRRSILRLKLNFKILLFSLSVLAILFVGSFFLSIANVDLFSLIIRKIIIRADSYPLLNLDSLMMLSDEYSGNIFYFFHPFLKLIGLKAYDMPMGSFLVSGGSNLSQIGGPNIHLPVVLFILGGTGFFGYAFIIFFGTVFSLLLCYARKAIISYVNYPNQRSSIFWPIFFFNIFPLLLQEPSAFGHDLFFAFFVYCSLRFIRPSLLHLFSKS